MVATARATFSAAHAAAAPGVERRGDVTPLASARERNAAALARDGDFAFDQEHAILPIDGAAPEFGAAHPDLGKRRRNENVLVLETLHAPGCEKKSPAAAFSVASPIPRSGS